MLTVALSVAATVAGVVNLLHWTVRRNHFLYWPTGTLGLAVNTFVIAQPVLAIAFLAGKVSNDGFIFVIAVQAVFVNLYSIYRRSIVSGLSTTAAA